MAAMPDEGSAISLAPRFEVSGEEIEARMGELQQFVRRYLKDGEDYGIIPGTKKPTLFKPGAEKLADVYGFTREFAILQADEDWTVGRFAYTVKATLRSMRTGLVVAEGLGECNSMEAGFRFLWVKENRVPREQRAALPSRTTKWGTELRIVNDDPYSKVNTYLKMAKKRALVDAVLSATRSSGLFTQDLEDLAANGVVGVTVTEDGEIIEPAPRTSPPKGTPPAKGTTQGPAPRPAGPPDAQAVAMQAMVDALGAARAAGVSDAAIADAVHAVAPKPRSQWTAADATAAAQAIDHLRATHQAPPAVDAVPF